MLRAGLVVLALATIATIATGGFVLTRCDERRGLDDAPQRRVQSARSIQWQAPIEVAHGPAEAGPWRMNESEFLYVDDATVALDDARTIGVAWVDNTRKDVLFQRYDPRGRPAHQVVNVSRSPAVFSWLPRIVVTERRVFVLWQEIVFSGGSHGGEIFFARSDDGGRTFAEPVNLSNSKAGDGKGQFTREHWHNGSLDLLRSADGLLIAAWTAYEGSLFVSRSEDSGASWSPPVEIPRDDPLPARAPALARAPKGTLYLAWSVGRDASAGIRVARSNDHGRTFGTPSIVASSKGYADAPKLAVDNRGTVHLVYTMSLAGFFGPYQVCYARSRTDGSFAASRVIAGRPHDEHGASFPSIALDHRGRVYLVWEHHPDSNGAARGLGFAYSDSGGDSFTRSSTVPGTTAFELGANGSHQGKLMQKLGVHASGRIALVDTRFQAGERSVVRLILGDPG